MQLGAYLLQSIKLELISIPTTSFCCTYPGKCFTSLEFCSCNVAFSCIDLVFFQIALDGCLKPSVVMFLDPYKLPPNLLYVYVCFCCSAHFCSNTVTIDLLTSSLLNSKPVHLLVLVLKILCHLKC